MIKNVGAQGWVSCPLGINLLLSLLKGSKADTEKYNQISRQLQKKKECLLISKLFSKSSKNIGEVLISADVEIRDCPLDALAQWAEKFTLIKNNIPEESDFILANISTFKGSWKASRDGALMRVYNSFNYTQDVKYEARLLEFPMKEEFKFIIIVPNENDVLQILFRKLANEGLASAIRSIQPVFIASSESNAPRIKIGSETVLKVDAGILKNFWHNMEKLIWMMKEPTLKFYLAFTQHVVEIIPKIRKDQIFHFSSDWCIET